MTTFLSCKTNCQIFALLSIFSKIGNCAYYINNTDNAHAWRKEHLALKKTWFIYVKAFVYHCLKVPFQVHNSDSVSTKSRTRQCVHQYFLQKMKQKYTYLRFGNVYTDHTDAKISWHKTHSIGKP